MGRVCRYANEIELAGTHKVSGGPGRYMYAAEPNIWKQHKDEAVEKLGKVKHLHAEYLRFFEIEKARLEVTPERNQFNFPAMGVFGKSDSFIARVKIVERMLGSMDTWEMLNNSQIDGLEVITTMVKTTIKTIKGKPYDPLDIRQLAFDSDQAAFFASMAENKARLQAFCNEHFEAEGVTRRMQLHTDFEKIRFLGIELDVHYKYTLKTVIGAELENVRKVYVENRNAPPIPRNMPPLAGRIAWSQNLAARLSYPIMQLQALRPTMLKEPCHQKLVRQYNKIRRVLVEFETICWNTWAKAATDTFEGLKGSVIISDAPGSFKLNLDPQVEQLVSETKWMGKLNQEQTPDSLALVKQSLLCFDQARRLEGALAQYSSIVKSMPPTLVDVLSPIKDDMISTLQTGIRTTSWVSVSTEQFIATVFSKLNECQTDINSIIDLVAVRIDNKLEAMRTTDLCAMPPHGDAAWSTAEFEAESDALCTSSAAALENISREVERSVDHLLEKVNISIQSHRRTDPDYVEACEELKKLYVQELGNALTKCIRGSLDKLKHRSAQRLIKYGSTGGASKAEDPVISANVSLALPAGAVMAPTLDMIQICVTKASENIVGVAAAVLLWGQDRALGASTLKNHTEMLSGNKELTRGMESISTTINQTKGALDDTLARFDKYSMLWKNDIKEELAKFSETNPDLSAFTEMIGQYEEMDVAIEAMEDTISVGSLELNTASFKLALLNETGAASFHANPPFLLPACPAVC